MSGTEQMAGPVAVAMALQPNPPRAGQQAELAFTLSENGQALTRGQVTCELLVDMPETPLNAPAIALENDGPGRWRTSVTFPRAGGWSAALKVMEKGAEPRETTFHFAVGP